MINHSLTFQHKTKWQEKNAVILTNSENMYIVIKDLMQRVGWTVTVQAKNIQEVFQSLLSGQANLIVIDDHQDAPSTLAVRDIIAHPLGAITPMLVFLLDKNKKEHLPISNLAPLRVGPKPLTPTSFFNAFQSLIRLWEQQEMVALRLGWAKAVKTDPPSNIAIFSRLMEIPSLRTLVSRPLALTYFKLGQVKEAEKILLTAIKEKPTDLGLVMTISHVYGNSAMEKLANRILKSAYVKNQDSNILIPDILQTAMLMGDYQQCINLLNTLINREFMPSYTSHILGRVLYGAGLHKQSAFILGNQDQIFRKIEAQWKQPSEQSLNKVG